MIEKNYQEMENHGDSFVFDKKPLSANLTKMICQKCHQLVSEGLLILFECLSSSENKQYQMCILSEMESRNQFRQACGGRPLSHTQVDAAMQGFLKIIGSENGTLQHRLENNKQYKCLI